MTLVKELVALGLPAGFGTEIDLCTGESRKQIGPGEYEYDNFEAIADAYFSRAAARKLLAKFRKFQDDSNYPLYRVVRCGYSLVSNGKGVEVYRAVEHQKAHFGGLVQCGSIWHCKVCARKISVRRRSELLLATNRTHFEGGACGLMTCTIRHASHEKCGEVLNRLQKMFARLNGDRASQKIKKTFQIFGQIRAFEFTRGLHGWHPHIHSLLFAEKSVPWQQVSDAMYDRWFVTAKALYGWELPRLALDVRGGASAGEYINKWGIESELAYSHKKQGHDESRNSFQVLDDYANGDASSGDAWIDFATAVSRTGALRVQSTRQLVWSKGLKDRFKLSELTDEEIAAQQEEPAILLGTLTLEQWLKVRSQPFEARPVLLKIASVGTFEDVLLFVNNLPDPLKPRQ